jgi:HEAT repeat protein
MVDSLIHVDWSRTAEFTDEGISYYLYLEGKSADAVSKIRNINKETVQSHILNGKIKYGIIAKCRSIDELFTTILNSSKSDKMGVLNYLENYLENELVKYIVDGYADMLPKEKKTAVWILGELKHKEGYHILIKASVHKHVNIRRMSVSAMGKISDKFFETALMKALDDINPQVILYSIKSLSKMESTRASGKIKNIHENTDKEYLKAAAEKWLESNNIT